MNPVCNSSFINSFYYYILMATPSGRKRILAAASMNGGAEAVAPVIMRLKEQGSAVRVIAYGAAAGQFRAMKLEPDRILESSGFLEAGALPREFVEFCPTAVLTGTQAQDKDHELTLDQACIIAAHYRSGGINRRIPVIAVLDTWANYLQRFSDLDTCVSPPSVRTPLIHLPHRIAIMDEFARREMLALGFPAERLAVTGSPHFELVAQQAAGFSAATRQGLLGKPVFASFHPEGRLIVFLSDSWKDFPDIGFTEAGVLRSFLESADNVSAASGIRINVIVRPHPFRGQDAKEAFDGYTPTHVRAVLHNPVTARGGDPANDYSLEALLYSAEVVVGTFGNPNITAAVIRTACGCTEPFIIQWVPGLTRKYQEPPNDFQRFLYESGVTHLVAERSDLVLLDALRGRLHQKAFDAARAGATDRVIRMLGNSPLPSVYW